MNIGPSSMPPMLRILFCAAIAPILFAGCDPQPVPTSGEEQAAPEAFSGGSPIADAHVDGTGAEFDSARFYAVSEYEPLDPAYSNRLPSYFTLEDYAPPVQDQGDQCSCVGWATAYAALTIADHYARGVPHPARDSAFSPAFVYHRIKKKPECWTTTLAENALALLRDSGCVRFADFPYDNADCTTLPGEDLKQRAMQHRIANFQRIPMNPLTKTFDERVFQQMIHSGVPVVVYLKILGSLNKGAMDNRDSWLPINAELTDLRERMKNRQRVDQHAVCVIGYDNEHGGGVGAFQIMNSWGTGWGTKGMAWISYPVFHEFVTAAFALLPAQRPATADDRARWTLGFELVDDAGQATGRNLRLFTRDKGVFRTRQPITPGTRFKVLIDNQHPAYVYAITRMNDGSMGMLFPPEGDNVSPYCGVPGRRVFPRGRISCEADDVGTMDVFAIIMSDHELDMARIRQRMGTTSTDELRDRLYEALGPDRVLPTGADAGDLVGLVAPLGGVVAAVFELEKRGATAQ